MMSLSSLSFVHPKNVGFHPIREKSKSNVMKKQRRRRRLQANTPQTRAMAAVQDEEATKPQPEPANWEYKYLYDGACPVCRSLKAGLEGKSTLSLQRGVLCVGGWVFKIRARKHRKSLDFKRLLTQQPLFSFSQLVFDSRLFYLSLCVCARTVSVPCMLTVWYSFSSFPKRHGQRQRENLLREHRGPSLRRF
jgi:hypothetical protein